MGPLSSLVLKVIPVNVSPRLFWTPRAQPGSQNQDSGARPDGCEHNKKASMASENPRSGPRSSPRRPAPSPTSELGTA